MSAMVARQRGLTLIEVLVALALMALLSVISWRALDATDRSVHALQSRIQETQSLVRVLGQVEHDLKQHVGWVGEANILPGVLWDAPVLSVVRTQENGAWQLVEWRQDEGRLLRAVSDPSYTVPLPELNRYDVVLENIASFSVRVWGADQQWIEPGARGGAMPAQTGMQGVEIRIVRLEGEDPVTFRKVVVLP